MTNHMHLLLTPKAANSASRMMQSVGRRYVRYINSKYLRRGTLWEGRFKSDLIDSECYLLHQCSPINCTGGINLATRELIKHCKDVPVIIAF